MSASAPTNHWKLGLFVVVGFMLMLGTVAWLGARSLRKEVGRYYSYFDESVQGLEVGSPIKFRGVTIGTVGKIDIANDHRHVEITSELGKAELTRLGLDMVIGPIDPDKPRKLEQGLGLRAQLVSSGLTGVKFLQLDFFPVAENPEPVLPFLVPENYIPAVPSTMKNIEDSLVRVVQRLPELVDQMGAILNKVDFILGGLKDKDLPERLVAVLDNANTVLGEAQKRISGLDTSKLSKDASKTLRGLSEAVGKMNALLGRVDGDKGLLSSVTRASDALGDTVRGADGVGGQLEGTLTAVEKAAKSIQKLANALEKDPDMLLKGRGRGVEADR
jgi:phospholipid/cholesterol/gamma-HCH transport system substrate-binding protein